MGGKSQSQIQKERTALAAGYREGGLLWCQCCPARGFTMENELIRRWTDMHERVLRSRGGDATDESNIILLCRECHEYVHKHPEWATANGFMAHAWDY